MVRFTINYNKAIEAIDWIARQRPGITQYYIGKVMFFADREHLLDFGRPISGDRYLAMEHGPVPSVIRDLLKRDSDYPDEVIDHLSSRVIIRDDGNKRKVTSLGSNEFPSLSETDRAYLSSAIESYADLSFSELKRISHLDPAYSAAWERMGNANEMDMRLWLNDLEDPEVALEQYTIKATFGA